MKFTKAHHNTSKDQVITHYHLQLYPLKAFQVPSEPFLLGGWDSTLHRGNCMLHVINHSLVKWTISTFKMLTTLMYQEFPMGQKQKLPSCFLGWTGWRTALHWQIAWISCQGLSRFYRVWNHWFLQVLIAATATHHMHLWVKYLCWSLWWPDLSWVVSKYSQQP